MRLTSADIADASLNAQSSSLVTLSRDGTVQRWERRLSAKLLDPLRIATLATDRTARIWDAKTGAPVGRNLVAYQWRRRHSKRRWIPSSRCRAHLFVATLDGTARVWDAFTGVPFAAVMAHEAGVTGLNPSADGARIITSSLDQTARVWDARTGRPLGIALHHDGVVSTGRDKRRVWPVSLVQQDDASDSRRAAASRTILSESSMTWFGRRPKRRTERRRKRR